MKNEKTERARFALLKLKVLKEGVKIEYRHNVVIGKENFGDEFTYASTKFPHPDLTEPLKALKPYLAQVFSLDTMVNAARDFKLSSENTKKVVLIYQEQLDKIDILGISIGGSLDNKKVVIKAMIKAPNGSKMAVNTHPISMSDSEVYDWTEKLQHIAAALEDEAYSYIFENKMAQMTMAFGEDKEQAIDGKSAAAGE